MLLIPCPWCGPRPETEFRHAGEAHLRRAPEAASDADWTGYLYARGNPKGWHDERWRHLHGCGRFFNARRHTLTDAFAASWKPGEAPP